jgi:hypothetical protein
MRRMLLSIAGLVVLLFLLDQLYRLLHPHVNLVRAALVGATGWLALAAAWRAGLRWIQPLSAALAIWLSATLSVLAIEAGWLVSRSAVSALLHVAILALAFPLLDGLGVGRPRTGPAQGELR